MTTEAVGVYLVLGADLSAPMLPVRVKTDTAMRAVAARILDRLPPHPRLEIHDGDVHLVVGPSLWVELEHSGIRGDAASPVTAAALARIGRTVLDHL